MKSRLIQKLSRVEDFEDPRVSLEQYMTPPELAADILHTASMQGDVGEGKKVVDLGCGTGIFAVGAALLGSEVVAVERDPDALQTARENAGRLGVEDRIEFVEKDVDEFSGSFDSCIMNPPFSVHSEEGIKFLEKAFSLSDTVYSVVYGGRKKSIKDFVGNSEHELRDWQDYRIDLPPTHGFHTEESHETDIGVLITRRV